MTSHKRAHILTTTASLAGICILFLALGSLSGVLGLRDFDRLHAMFTARVHELTPAREKLLLLQMRLKSVLVAERSLFATDLSVEERLAYYNRYQQQKHLFHIAMQETDAHMRTLTGLPGTSNLWERGRTVLDVWDTSNDRVLEALDRWHAVQSDSNDARAVALLREAQGLSMGVLQPLQLNATDIIDVIVEHSAVELNSATQAILRLMEQGYARTVWLLGIFLASGFCLGAVAIILHIRHQQADIACQEENHATNAQLRLLFDTMPMGCIVRDKKLRLRYVSLTAARMLGLDSRWDDFEDNAQHFGLDKWEYIDRYAMFSFPELQPNGENSQELMAKLHAQTLEKGMLRTRWHYQTADTTPLPVMLTMVRVSWYGDETVVARYFEPLREDSVL